MDAEKYARSVTLLCPTCGCSMLEELENPDSEHLTIRCPSCSRMMSKDELIQENSATIDAAIAEMGNEVVQDLQRELNDVLRKALSGSKHIRIT